MSYATVDTSLRLFDYLLMFASNFFAVFLLGIQSKNVHNSRMVAAIIVSFGISVAQFLFVRYASSGNLTVFLVCAAGGCCGIAFSIWFYDNFLHKKEIKEKTVELSVEDSLARMRAISASYMEQIEYNKRKHDAR